MFCKKGMRLDGRTLVGVTGPLSSLGRIYLGTDSQFSLEPNKKPIFLPICTHISIEDSINVLSV